MKKVSKISALLCVVVLAGLGCSQVEGDQERALSLGNCLSEGDFSRYANISTCPQFDWNSDGYISDAEFSNCMGKLLEDFDQASSYDRDLSSEGDFSRYANISTCPQFDWNSDGYISGAEVSNCMDKLLGDLAEYVYAAVPPDYGNPDWEDAMLEDIYDSHFGRSPPQKCGPGKTEEYCKECCEAYRINGVLVDQSVCNSTCQK